MPAPFLTAAWNNLVMANYVVDPQLLQPYLPPYTEPDEYKGNAYLSLIGFMFEDTRLLGVKIPFHVNFEEVNLRCYVRRYHNGIWKRGAVFIKEIVPKPAIGFIANTLYNEHYSTRRMKHFRKVEDSEINLGYQWKHQGKWNSIEATTASTTVPMQQGSVEQFIAEHYWGYSRYNARTTYEYEVQHPPWEIYPVKQYLVDCDFGAVYGKQFAFLDRTTPDMVLVAKGSPIRILHKNILLQ